jgi:hypothetical protein
MQNSFIGHFAVRRFAIRRFVAAPSLFAADMEQKSELI